MEWISNLIETLPWLMPVLASTAIGAALLILLSALIFRSRLQLAATVDAEGGAVRRLISPGAAIRHFRHIDRYAKANGTQLLSKLEVDEAWRVRLKHPGSKRIMKRLLFHFPDTSLFDCFLSSLKNRGRSDLLKSWVQDNEEFLGLRRIALSGKGEQFDGALALAMFSDLLPRIREMVGDYEWAARYMAVKILVHDDDKKSIRAIEEGLADGHPLIRKCVASEHMPATDEKTRSTFAKALIILVINDPVFEVRRAARDRLQKDFSDLYSIEPKSLDTVQSLHVLELLDLESVEDENVALHYLERDNLECRVPAALYLSKKGVLRTMLLQTNRGDRQQFERVHSLLRNACEVGVDTFLDKVSKVESDDALYMTSLLLIEFGPPRRVAELAEKVFSYPQSGRAADGYTVLYQSVLEAISVRGSYHALELLLKELEGAQADDAALLAILSAIPARGAPIFAESLMRLLKDPQFDHRNALRGCLARFEPGLVLPGIIAILEQEREATSHRVRMDAVKLLGALKLDYCIQWIVENLSAFPVEEARAFASTVSRFAGATLEARVEGLFASVDSRSRAAILSILPSTGEKGYLKYIKTALTDTDPDVRIAALWALHDFGDGKQTAEELLRDPVERVRVAAARAIGGTAGEETYALLRSVIEDPKESWSVKLSVIEGMGDATPLSSIDLITDSVDAHPELSNVASKALSSKTGSKELPHLIEKFRDGNPSLRSVIAAAFKGMRRKAESAIVSLLREQVQSLEPYLTDILNESGYIEATIRELSSRDPSVRRRAAETLSLIRTPSAFRGLVLAAKDPDKQVRVLVTKALEKLNTKEGRAVLDRLKEDPDARVRRYTFWATERLDAKNLKG